MRAALKAQEMLVLLPLFDEKNVRELAKHRHAMHLVRQFLDKIGYEAEANFTESFGKLLEYESNSDAKWLAEGNEKSANQIRNAACVFGTVDQKEHFKQ